MEENPEEHGDKENKKAKREGGVVQYLKRGKGRPKGNNIFVKSCRRKGVTVRDIWGKCMQLKGSQADHVGTE